MKQRLLILCGALALLFLCSSCGYHVGSIMHPQVQTIGIANVKNDTTSYNAGFQLQQLMAEQFQLDGSLKVVNRSHSDCIVYATITNVAYTEIAASAIGYYIYRPKIWQAEVTVEFTVIVPGVKDPLIPLRQVTGVTEFQSAADLETHQLSAVRLACRDAAQQIVQYTVEAW